MSCSVWRQQPSVRFYTLRTSLWTSPVPWPWALLDNTALDNGAWILRKCLLASFSRYYQRRAWNKTTNKTYDENLLWFGFFYILLLFIFSPCRIKAERQARCAEEYDLTVSNGAAGQEYMNSIWAAHHIVSEKKELLKFHEVTLSYKLINSNSPGR